MRKKLLTLGALLLLAAPGLAAQNATQVNNEPTRENCIGDRDAPIVLEVFSDFQCPACAQFYLGTVQPLLAEYVTAGTVCLIYREFPLEMRHPYARPAALYAVAAARVGQWMPVAGALYAFQEEWSKDGNIEAVLARELPTKIITPVRRAVKEPKLAAAIDRDLEHGRRLGVRSTPTWFLTANGRTERHTGVVQYSILKRYLDQLLGK